MNSKLQNFDDLKFSDIYPLIEKQNSKLEAIKTYPEKIN